MTYSILRTSLYQTIEKWVNKQIDTEARDWPDMYIHDDLIDQMTDAAFAVLRASAESSQYTEAESK